MVAPSWSARGRAGGGAVSIQHQRLLGQQMPRLLKRDSQVDQAFQCIVCLTRAYADAACTQRSEDPAHLGDSLGWVLSLDYVPPNNCKCTDSQANAALRLAFSLASFVSFMCELWMVTKINYQYCGNCYNVATMCFRADLDDGGQCPSDR